MTLPDSEVLTSIVSRVFRVDEVTLGDPKQGYYVRYKGDLLSDSIQAYDQLAEALHPYDITPLFRIEDGRPTVLLVRGTIHPKPGRISVNILLFILTVLSVVFTGATMYYSDLIPNNFNKLIETSISHLWMGWPFAVSLLAILLAHEFGHYFVGRARGVAVTLPYFLPLPFPLSPIGTLGAAIQMKSVPKNKRALFDLAVAGPLAGLVVAIPVLLYGLSTSHLMTVTAGSGAEGNSMLYLLAKFIIFGKLLPASANLSGLPLLYHWVSYFFIGIPSPVGSKDVFVNQVAWAGWVGLLVTFLNLIPAGQLDGGHVIYTIFGKRVKAILPIILVVLVGMGFLYSGWWLWAFLIFLLGRSHAEPLDQITQLDPRRKALAVLMLIIFLVVLTPIPFVTF